MIFYIPDMPVQWVLPPSWVANKYSKFGAFSFPTPKIPDTSTSY